MILGIKGRGDVMKVISQVAPRADTSASGKSFKWQYRPHHVEARSHYCSSCLA